MSLIVPKKPQILYAPMLSSFGGGSARGFNPGGGGGPVEFELRFLVIGGGGGGGDGNASGGAGGAGTLIEVAGTMTTDESIVFTATSGQGGYGGGSDNSGVDGYPSRFKNAAGTLDVTAYGGGLGASYHSAASYSGGEVGGSGGGGSGPSNNNQRGIAGQTQYLLTTSALTGVSAAAYANEGSSWNGGGSYGYGGGGGGAGGAAGSNSQRGPGRYYNWIAGSSIEYAAGGQGAGTEVGQSGGRVDTYGSGGGGLGDESRTGSSQESDGFVGAVMIRVPDTVVLSDITRTSGPAGYTVENLNDGGYNNYAFGNQTMTPTSGILTADAVYTFKIVPA